MTETGVVKWFNDEKGYGFIVRDRARDDVFVHHSAIRMNGHRKLSKGQQVEFEVVDTPKGLSATNVVVIE